MAIVLAQSTINLLIKLLGIVIVLGMVEAIVLALLHYPQDVATSQLASTALGGLIGLLVQPESGKAALQQPAVVSAAPAMGQIPDATDATDATDDAA